MMIGANTRRETKRQVIALRTMLRSNELSNEQRNAMSAHVIELRNKLDSCESQINPGEIAARREFLQKNKGMMDIFNTFWVTMLSHTTDGFLSKDGYTKFHQAIEIALAGQPTFGDIDQAAVDADWTYDRLLYGNMNKPAFFDMLFEIIETWTEIVDPTYYAAFAWALLDSVADTNAHPPKLRPHREMRCITKVQNEANMIRDYIKNKRIRAALSIESDMMQRVPEVQKRLHDRKRGMGVDEAQMHMIEALSLQASASIDFSDSEGESTHSAASLKHELLLQQMSWQGDDDREEDEDEDEEELELDEQGEEVIRPMNDELDDESVGGSVALNEEDELDPSELRDQFGVPTEGDEGSRSKASRKARRESKRGKDKYGMRQPTASFLAYCTNRRETRVALNGLYGYDSGSLTSGSLSNSLGSGGAGSMLDLSAMAMLPSTMATLSTDSGDDSASSSMFSSSSPSTLGGGRGQGSPGEHSRANSQIFNLSPAQSQQSSITQQVLNIPSPQNRSNPNMSPFGGNVGEKARFSQFMASGKRLGSFAKEYLVRHDMNSGLSLDNFTGGSRTVNNLMMSPATTTSAMQLSKSTTGLHRAAHSSNQLKAIKELTINPNASMVDLNLLGKTMSVPPTGTPKSRSAYQLLTPSQRSDRKTPQLQRTPKQPHHAFSGRSLVKQGSREEIVNDSKAAAASAEERDTTHTASADKADEGPVSSKKGVTAAKVSGKRGIVVVELTGSDQGAGVILKEDDGAAEQKAFGEAVEGADANKYFNVRDTQVRPFFRPEVTDELLALNRHSHSPGSKGQLNGSKPTTPKAVIPMPKAHVLDDRTAFLIVESQPPPVELRHTQQTASPTGSSSRMLSRTSTALSEIPAPEIGVEALVPAPGLTYVDSLLAHATAVQGAHSKSPQQRSVPPHHQKLHPNVPSHRSLGSEHPSVATINFPPSREGSSGYYPNSSNSPVRPALSRTSSNLSFADSEVSYDMQEHKRSLASASGSASAFDLPPGAGSDGHTPLMPVLYQRIPTGQMLFSDNLTSPPMSRQQQQGYGFNQHPHQQLRHDARTAVNPSIVLDPLLSSSPHGGVDLELSILSTNSHVPHVKRGTNLAITQSHHLPAKPEYATFPQGMYYSVVKNALDLRPQPNYNPSWDHRRASKNVRLSSLKNSKIDMTLSLTTAPITLNSAKKIEDAIRNADHQRKILIGTIPAERMKTPTNSLPKAPLTIKITAAAVAAATAAAEEEAAMKLGSSLDNSQSQVDAGIPSSKKNATTTATTSASNSRQGSPVPQLVPSFTESVPVVQPAPAGPGPRKNPSIPAPDALLQSIVEFQDPVELSDELLDELSTSVEGNGGSVDGGGGGSKVSRGSASGSLTGSATAKSVNSASTPHLLIKPVVSPKPLSVHNNHGSSSNRSSPERVRERDHSPPKGLFMDKKGKLQSRELQELNDNRELFEIHRTIDVSKNTGMSKATMHEHASHVVENTALLVPIKHPYLAMNGTKHILPDKVVASILNIKKNHAMSDPNASGSESVFLGNSASVLIRDSSTGHSSEVSTHNIPWLPGGSLDMQDNQRSNHLLGLREKLDLQRHNPVDSNRQVLTIRSQNAIRGAFEQYVQQRLHNPAQPHPVQFHQLSPQQQQLLLRQYEGQTKHQGSVENVK